MEWSLVLPQQVPQALGFLGIPKHPGASTVLPSPRAQELNTRKTDSPKSNPSHPRCFTEKNWHLHNTWKATEEHICCTSVFTSLEFLKVPAPYSSLSRLNNLLRSGEGISKGLEISGLSLCKRRMTKRTHSFWCLILYQGLPAFSCHKMSVSNDSIIQVGFCHISQHKDMHDSLMLHFSYEI